MKKVNFDAGSGNRQESDGSSIQIQMGKRALGILIVATIVGLAWLLTSL